jgi:hypothetical protein
MNDLLSTAIKAHGGMDRWSTVTSVEITASITGAIWHVKGKPDVLKSVVMTADTGSERLTTVFPGQDKRSVFEPDRVVIERADGPKPATTQRHPSPGRNWTRRGTTSTSPTSAARRCGPT